MALTRINNQALTNVTSAGLPSGTVLQVKRGTANTDNGDLTQTFADIGLSVSITPKSTNSEILIIVHARGYLQAGQGYALRLLRGTTEIFNPSASDGNDYIVYAGTSGNQHMPATFDYIDEPSTTSAVTYKVQARKYSSSTEAKVPSPGGTRNSTISITAMEIAG